MARGQMIDIQPEPERPFPWRNQDVGHITGTPPQDPPKPDGISVWTGR